MNEEIREDLKIESILKNIEDTQFIWFGHMWMDPANRLEQYGRQG